MFEDIIFEQPVVPVIKPRPKKEVNLITTTKTPRPPKMTAFQMVKQTDDLRMLTKILDLCKVKVRRQKKKARKAKRELLYK